LQFKLQSAASQLHQAREKLKAWEEQQACWESQRNELEQRVEDEVEKVEKVEKYGAIMYWQEAQTLCRVVSQRLSDAQSQTESLEIKYSKAKRLVREYQGREEERSKREADLRGEMEERERLHRETVERLQTQENESQESPSGSVPVPAQRSSRGELSSTSSVSAASPQPPTNSFITPPVYITDTTPSSCKSSESKKSKRRFPDFRVSTSGELLDTPAGISPSGSVSSMPSCLPFPWFGERGREKEVDDGRGRERLRSVSSSSLPYLTTTGRRDQVGRLMYFKPKKSAHCKWLKPQT
ncbi:unnamed protein product, partial [Tetraodon nigroviridis]